MAKVFHVEDADVARLVMVRFTGLSLILAPLAPRDKHTTPPSLTLPTCPSPLTILRVTSKRSACLRR